jgi:hypothetical protein
VADFPVQLTEQQAKDFPVVWRELPWDFVKFYRQQIEHNHGQTVERLAERGGLALQEVAAAVSGHDLLVVFNMDDIEAIVIIESALGDWRLMQRLT